MKQSKSAAICQRGNEMNESSTSNDEILTDRSFAQRYGLSSGTPAVWRCRGRGPKFFRMEGAVRYKLSDIEEWIRQQNGEGLAIMDLTEPLP